MKNRREALYNWLVFSPPRNFLPLWIGGVGCLLAGFAWMMVTGLMGWPRWNWICGAILIVLGMIGSNIAILISMYRRSQWGKRGIRRPYAFHQHIKEGEKTD